MSQHEHIWQVWELVRLVVYRKSFLWISLHGEIRRENEVLEIFCCSAHTSWAVWVLMGCPHLPACTPYLAFDTAQLSHRDGTRFLSKACESESRSVVSESLRPHGL